MSNFAPPPPDVVVAADPQDVAAAEPSTVELTEARIAPTGAIASLELAARARAVAVRYGLPRTADACCVSRAAYLGIIARWPTRLATVELVRSRLDQLAARGFGP